MKIPRTIQPVTILPLIRFVHSTMTLENVSNTINGPDHFDSHLDGYTNSNRPEILVFLCIDLYLYDSLRGDGSNLCITRMKQIISPEHIQDIVRVIEFFGATEDERAQIYNSLPDYAKTCLDLACQPSTDMYNISSANKISRLLPAHTRNRS